MADEIINVRGESPMNDPNRMGGGGKVTKKPSRRASRLDSPEIKKLHAQLLSWFYEERDRQSVNRYHMAIDEDYFDGLQWSEEDAEVLAERDQAPLVFNKVKPTVEWMTGTEKRTRIDYKILPREESDEATAEVKTKLFKYLSDVNNAGYARSDAFHDAIVAGLGWIEEGVNTEPGQELIYIGSESWRNVLHDSLATRRDLKDGRYLYRWKWLDEDVAVALIPDRANYIRAAAMDADEIAEKDEDIWYLGARNNKEEADFSSASRMRVVRSAGEGGFSKRKRVKIIEAWYRKPVPAKVMRGNGQYDGEVYDETDPGHLEAVEAGDVTLATTLHMKMCVMLMTENHVLFHGDTPYRHNDFPLTPLWCYRRKRDNMPYGKIRDVRDAQDDLNKRASKALFILSSNQIIMDTEAVNAKDIELLREEAARPDGIIAKKKGTELTFRQDKQLAEEHLMLMDRDAKMIQDIGGVTDDNLGRRTNAQSGIAIERRQDQGSTITFNIFDNKRFAEQISGGKVVSLMEQFYTASKVVRIVGENKPIEWVPVNQIDPTTGAPVNAITASRADFIIGQQDYYASLREAAAAQLLDMLAKIAPVMPQAAVNLLDLVVEMMDIPNREEVVSRIRKINGQSDPTKRPDPKQEQARAIQDAMAQKAAALNLDKLEAEVNKLRATTGQLDAQAFARLIEGMYSAIQAAQVITSVPAVAPVADVIAQGAGFKDKSGTDPNLPQPAQLALPIDQGMSPNPPLQADGVNQGIETAANDGVQQ